MKNVKLTKTLNIEIGSRKLTFTEDEAFDLYSALAKVFGPLGDDDYVNEDEEPEEEPEIDEDEDEDEETIQKDKLSVSEIMKILEDLKKRSNRGNLYPLMPTNPMTPFTPWYDPKDIPNFPQIWCSEIYTTK